MAFGRFLWATALTLVGVAGASAQTDLARIIAAPTAPAGQIEDPRPTSPYDLKPEHGAWLVAVKSFRAEREHYADGRCVPDQRSKELADQFAAYIRKEVRINAYVYPRGWVLRVQRDIEAEEYRSAARRYYKSKGIEPTKEMLKVKTVSIPDEYTVFVAPARTTLKDRETAIDFANQVRKLEAPSEFNDSLLQGSDRPDSKTSGRSFNAFLACMPGLNPTVKKDYSEAPVAKADKFLMDLNSSESYSLLHKTRKTWTVLVQTYGGGGTILQTGAADGGQSTNRLELAAQQAHEVAGSLRQRKFDAYVMHTRYHSMVFVGDYADRDDPQLQATVKTFAGMQLREQLPNKALGKVLETFMEKPAPVMILKP